MMWSDLQADQVYWLCKKWIDSEQAGECTIMRNRGPHARAPVVFPNSY